MITKTRPALSLSLCAAALAVAASAPAMAQNTFGGQPVDLPPAVEVAKPKKTDTLTVHKNGPSGTYRSLTAAVADASDGDVIKVVSEVYDEPGLQLTKSLTIMSDAQGDRRPIIRVSNNSPCLSQSGQNVRTVVSNMVFVAGGGQSCIVVNSGDFAMRHSAVYDREHIPRQLSYLPSGGNSERYLSGGSQRPAATNASLRPNHLVTINGGHVDLFDNDVFGGTQAAIAVSRQANNMGMGPSGVQLTKNTIRHSDLHGVLVDGFVEVSLVGNNIALNGSNKIAEHQRPRSSDTDNRPDNVKANGGYGVYSVGYGSLDMNTNIISGNANGVYLGDDNSHVSMQGNRVVDNHANGAMIWTDLVSQGDNTVTTSRRNQCAIVDHTNGSVFSDRENRRNGKVCRN
ncbi:MAG: right-handed parallel beta-helix repeat-containing protein [Pseudomonadota bacterium]